MSQFEPDRASWRPGHQIGLAGFYGLFMSTIDPLVRQFCDQLRAEGFAEAQQMEAALHSIDIEGDFNLHATCMWAAIVWILAREDRTVSEKIVALNRVLTNRGTIRLPADLGWS